MYQASRPPLRRIMLIDQAVRSGTWPNTTTLANDLEVNRRTIRRDIAYLCHQLHAPIEFDPDSKRLSLHGVLISPALCPVGTWRARRSLPGRAIDEADGGHSVRIGPPACDRQAGRDAARRGHRSPRCDGRHAVGPAGVSTLLRPGILLHPRYGRRSAGIGWRWSTGRRVGTRRPAASSTPTIWPSSMTAGTRSAIAISARRSGRSRCSGSDHWSRRARGSSVLPTSGSRII